MTSIYDLTSQLSALRIKASLDAEQLAKEKAWQDVRPKPDHALRRCFTAWAEWLPICSIENVDLVAMPRLPGEKVRLMLADGNCWINTIPETKRRVWWERTRPSKPSRRPVSEREAAIAGYWHGLTPLIVEDLETDPRLAVDLRAFEELESWDGGRDRVISRYRPGLYSVAARGWLPTSPRTRQLHSRVSASRPSETLPTSAEARWQLLRRVVGAPRPIGRSILRGYGQ